MSDKPGSSAEELDHLVRQVEDLEKEIDRRYRSAVHAWHLRLGPIHLRGQLGSQAITLLYLAFCAAGFATGAGLLISRVTRELGVAMVVGSIFAGASFIGQWWAVQVQHERQMSDRLLGESRFRELERIMERRADLVSKIERLDPSNLDRQTS